MEIIKEYKSTRDGNDCIIYEYLCMIKMSDEIYSVVYVKTVKGDWINTNEHIASEVFTDYQKALQYMCTYIRES